MEYTNDEYIENLIIKGATTDKQLLVTICSVYKKEYFENSIVGELFLFLKDYVEKYDSIPSRDIIYNSVKDSEEYFKEVDSLDIDVIKDYDYIFDKTNEYLKDRALKTAILDSVEVINKGESENNGLIQKYIEEAICKDLKIDLGLDYFNTNKLRLKRIITNTVKRVPTYLPTLDEYISGGFPPYTLSIFTARIHGFKCLDENSTITIRRDGKIENIKIGNLYNNELKEQKMGGNLNNFIKKYGKKEGQRRYDLFRKRNSEAKKGKKIIDLFIKKYGEDVGKQKYSEYLLKIAPKGRGTKEWYIKKYGKDGEERYNNYIENLKKSNKGINTRKYYIKKYGKVEGERLYNEKNKKVSDKGRGTLSYFIKRYGEIEGEKRFKLYIERQKRSHSLEGYIERFGEKEGKDKWEKRMFHLKHTTSLEGFVMRHGKKEGKKRWIERQEKWHKSYKKSNFSIVSQKLFWDLYKSIKNDYKEIYFAQLNENKKIDNSGKNNEYTLKLNDGVIRPDFFVKDVNKVIEFDGDYWHGEKMGNQKKDSIRDEMIKTSGYDVLHILERDYNNDPHSTLKKCLEFINE